MAEETGGIIETLAWILGVFVLILLIAGAVIYWNDIVGYFDKFIPSKWR